MELIFNLDAFTYAGNLQSLSDIEEHFGGKRYFFERASICDKERVHKIITDFKPDTIVKFAAESHVDRSIDGPLEFIETNVTGTAVMLIAAMDYYKSLSDEEKKGFRFHHVSTDEVYGSLGDTGLFLRTTPTILLTIFGVKSGSDHLLRAWHRTFGCPSRF